MPVASVIPACAKRLNASSPLACQQSAGEWNEMRRIEEVEHATSQRQHRKRADAAWPSRTSMGEEILKRQAQKKAQSK